MSSGLCQSRHHSRLAHGTNDQSRSAQKPDLVRRVLGFFVIVRLEIGLERRRWLRLGLSLRWQFHQVRLDDGIMDVGEEGVGEVEEGSVFGCGV